MKKITPLDPSNYSEHIRNLNCYFCERPFEIEKLYSYGFDIYCAECVISSNDMDLEKDINNNGWGHCKICDLLLVKKASHKCANISPYSIKSLIDARL